MIRNIIVTSDTHCGCQLGLFPKSLRIPLDSGGFYTGSPLQMKVWSYWEEFWKKWVPMVTKGEPFIWVLNGDAIDGIHHNAVTQITQNMADQIVIAEKCFEPIRNLKTCKKMFLIRGTEAHVGKSGQYEEILGKNLGVEKDESEKYSRWELWLRMNNVLTHFTHHVGTTNSTAYESTAVYKELVEAYSEAGRWKDEPPDVVIRSHRHRAFKIEVPSENGQAIALCTAGWQLKTPFVYRQLLGRSATPQFGGCLIRMGDEDRVYARFKTFKVDRPKAVVV